MGLNENLFPRKVNNPKRTATRSLASSSQQHRLDLKARLEEENRLKAIPRRYVMNLNGLNVPIASPTPSGGCFSDSVCICYRNDCVITCINFRCSWTGVGRVRSLCKSHPTVTFLLDFTQCPLCFCGLREVPDRPIPAAK